MLNEATITKLYELRLNIVAQKLREQSNDTSYLKMEFEDRLGLLVDAEWDYRRSNKLMRLIKAADYFYRDACVEDIKYHADRNLNKNVIERLALCRYIQENHNIILLGATGCGKTYLANALGVAANRNYYASKYIRLPSLLDELAIARGEGKFRQTIKRYQQVPLLILDEWMLLPLREAEVRDLFEIIDARCKRASTIFCSQSDVDNWHYKIGQDTLADAICDRIVHDSYRIEIHGDESMRKRMGINTAGC
jgi:DNA replication protein DnaC